MTKKKSLSKIQKAQELQQLKDEFKTRYSQINRVARDAAVSVVKLISTFDGDYFQLNSQNLHEVLKPHMGVILEELLNNMETPSDPIYARLPRHNLGSFLATVKDGVLPYILKTSAKYYTSTIFNVLRSELTVGGYTVEDLLMIYEEDFLYPVITSIMNVWSSYSGMPREDFAATVGKLKVSPADQLYEGILKVIKATLTDADPLFQEAITKQ